MANPRDPAPGDPSTRALMLLWGAGLAAVVLLIYRKVNSTPEYGLVFNDMLARLLQGRFDLDPSVIGTEAFVHGGRAYAYFGVFCALLRLPLWLTGQMGVDMTKASMIGAAGLSLAARLGAMRRALTHTDLPRELRLILMGAVAFGGESLQYLRPGLFQEVSAWGAALAAVFVWLAVTRIFGAGRRTGALYAGMAVLAGLALICRVSFGLGLYAALGLMLAVEAWRARGRLPVLRTLAPAVLVLALFLGAAGAVNAARWGDPSSFVPLRYQVYQRQRDPDRVWRLDHYGAANLQRAPFALQYYFAPVWEFQDRQGLLLFQKTQLDLFDSVELPPSSLLLSDPAICLLAGLGVWALLRRPGLISDRPTAGAALAGLLLAPAVMLTAISLAFRYRMDFYPSLDFAACLGAASLGAWARARLFLYLALGGALAAFAGLMLYDYSPYGPALDLDLRGGWTTPILQTAQGRDPYIGHLLPDGRRLAAPNGR